MDSDQIFDEMFGSMRGRKAAQDSATYVRDVNRADMLAMQVPGAIQPLPLKSIRTSHHMLAQLLANGRKPAECQLITGYSLSRISVLQADPAFKELVEHYRTQVEEIYLNVHERLAALGVGSLEELQDRLENEPEGWTKKELLDLAALTLDRAGFGPKSTVNHNVRGVIMTDETLARIKAEAAARSSGVVRTLQDHNAPIDSFPGPSRAELVHFRPSTEGLESERAGIREEVREISEERNS